MSKEDCDYMVNVLLLGDYNCGKTSLMHRFVEDTFTEEYNANANLDFKVRKIPIGSHLVRMNIWDTAGKEKDFNLCYTYFRGANGVMLTFDVTNQTTFKNLRKWMELVLTNCCDKCRVLLVGCKSDQEGCVMQEQIDKFVESQEQIIGYVETSAKSGNNVDAIFMKLLLHILGRIGEKKTEEPISQHERSQRGCCSLM